MSCQVSSKMKLQWNKSHIQTFLNIFIFIGLLGAFGYFYLFDIIEKYKNKDTTFTTRQEPATDDRQWPSVTLCMQSPFNTEILNKSTGLQSPQLFTNMEPEKKPDYQQLYDRASFRLQRDFKLSINWKKIKEPGIHSITGNGNVTIEQIHTEMYGMCYSITPSNDYETNRTIPITVEPKESCTSKGMIVLVSTQNTVKNIIPRSWPHLTPFMLNQDFEEGGKVIEVFLSETLWKFYGGNPDCQLGCQPKNCLNFEEWMEKVRCNECMPVVLQDFYDNDTLPFCSHFGEQKCMIHAHNFGIKEKFETCEYPMSDMEYSAIIKKEDQFLLNSNHNYTTIKISFLSSTRTIKEEILVYDESTLIGTLGGFLGLFVGFSFFGLIGYFIEKLLSFF